VQNDPVARKEYFHAVDPATEAKKPQPYRRRALPVERNVDIYATDLSEEQMGQWLRLKEVMGVKFHGTAGMLENSTVPTMNSSSVSMPDFVAQPLVGTTIQCLSPLSRDESSTESTPDESWSSATALDEPRSNNMALDESISDNMAVDASVPCNGPAFDISMFDEIMEFFESRQSESDADTEITDASTVSTPVITPLSECEVEPLQLPDRLTGQMVYNGVVKNSKQLVGTTHEHGEKQETVVFVAVSGKSDVTMEESNGVTNTSNEDSDDTMMEQNTMTEESHHIVEPIIDHSLLKLWTPNLNTMESSVDPSSSGVWMPSSPAGNALSSSLIDTDNSRELFGGLADGGTYPQAESNLANTDPIASTLDEDSDMSEPNSF
jgi:hypothetical protein